MLEDGMTLVFIILPFFWSGLMILDKQTSVYEIARYEKRSDRLSMEILDVLFLSGLMPILFSIILFLFGLLQEVQVPSFLQFILLYFSAYIEFVLFGLVFLVIKKIFHSPFISLFLCSAIFILIFYREIGVYRIMIQKIFIYSSFKGEGLISLRSVPKGILIGFLTVTLQFLFQREDVLL
ncbi:MAG: hypothetical protein Q4P28_02835 [Tissierellia bacterium]|nr:hypothetical protein [Tissierellia bacterium]